LHVCVVLLRHFDAETFVQCDEHVQEVEGIEVDLLAQRLVRL
jgi:hypothetical protein